MQDEIVILKKDRNDAYHQNQILREDIGRIMERLKVIDSTGSLKETY
jgi:hypothetical protein